MRWVVPFVILFFACSTASVLADSGDEATERPAAAAEAPAAPPTPAEIEAAQAAQVESESPTEIQRSRTAYTEFSASEARELLVEEFPEQLAGLNADPARVLTDAQIEKPLGTYAARVSIGGGESGIVESTIPVESEVRSGEKSPVDLSLEREGDQYAPANPPTATELPATAEGPIQLESGIEVGLPVSDDHEAQPLGEMNLFYPETEQTTDTLIAPTAGGVEVFEQLRSPESPEEFRLPLVLPEQARLRGNEEGGAEVVSGEGDQIAEILPPSAVDAIGENVPVETKVEGEELIIDVPHSSESLAYPILLDPIVKEDGWNVPGKGGFDGWWWPNNWMNRYDFWNEGSALHLASRKGAAYSAAEWVQFEYTPPNSTAYIEAASCVCTYCRSLCASRGTVVSPASLRNSKWPMATDRPWGSNGASA
jgi:hypothetical protein